MRWNLILGLVVLLTVTGAACVGADPTPPQQAPIPKSRITLKSLAALAAPATLTPEPAKPKRRVIQARQPASQPDDTTPTLELLERPNILLILTDDLDTHSIKFMPRSNPFSLNKGPHFQII
jgi:hypothetical protein